MLSAAAHAFDRNTWVEVAEEDSKSTFSLILIAHSSAYQPSTTVESQMVLLNQVLLAFLTAATNGLKAGSGNPVFITGVQRSHGSAVKYIGELLSFPFFLDLS